MVLSSNQARTLVVSAPARTVFVPGGVDMSSSPPEFFKRPVSSVVYTVDYNAELDRFGGNIASAYWVVPCALPDSALNTELPFSDAVVPVYGATPSPTFALGGTKVRDGTHSVQLAGGTEGKSYLIESVITTDTVPPQIYSQQLSITVQN